VLGLAAFGRTQEKIAGANNGGLQSSATGFASGPSTFGAPQAGGFGNSGNFNSSAPNNFGGGFASAPPTSYSPAPSWGTTPTSGFGAPPVTTSGKKIVPQDPDPAL
jgi:hypothetical protein